PLTKPTLTLLTLALILAACTTSSPIPSPLSPTVTSAPLPTPLSPTATSTPLPSTTITILYTADEHGWMSGQENGQGAAELYGLFQSEYNLGEDPSVILLSGGDNWTGPAISTWFDGEGMVEVMNAMGYSASAVGNHEFDFGLDVLQARLDEADFPYLSANLRLLSDGTFPTDLGIQPYTILEVAGLQVGLTGLSATFTPLVANPAYLTDFQFIDYQPALREVVPQMRQAGAQVILVIAHLCPDDLELLARQVDDLGIALMGGGHCHIAYARQAGDTALLASAANMNGYAYATLSYDPATQAVTPLDLGTRPNQGGQPDPEVARIVAGWQSLTDAELNIEIGYLQDPIREDSQPMQDLITESWIWAYPNADIALTNLGGMRTDLPAGPLTIAHLISVMPFNNVIVEVHLTGAQVISVLAHGGHSLAIGGMHRQGSGWLLENTGASLDPDALYSVLVNDFMYAGGDGYTLLAEADPDAYQTGIDWRQPVIDWILSQASSPDSPLDAAIALLNDR
ncbi:MAG TPA: bifunctional UDP-sugar hydrolase/5'-nucleotidase, partial [Anaerolineales bacterium]|nr:bifunctional UDP-sugar hydrolase/5'-nucleotidase [Anaerolineales bacterium]